MKLRKALSTLFSVVMVLTLLPTMAFADGTAAEITPAYDWYSGSATEYTIDSVEDLAGLANIANGTDGQTQFNFTNTTVTLANNLDLNNLIWTPISNFSGTFDGAENTISNLTDAAGLFNTVSEGGEIKNLKLDNVNADLAANVGYGFIAVNMQGNATNCHISNVTVKRAGYSNAKGGTLFKSVAGNAIIDNCSAANVTIIHTANVNNTDCVDGLGGVFGGASGNAYIKNCTGDNIKMTFANKTKRVGGFIEGIGENAKIENCTLNNFTIGEKTGDGYLQEVGGFAATTSGNAAIVNCTVKEATFLTGRVSRQTGGFVGQALSGEFNGCAVENVTMDITARGSNTTGSTAGFCGQTNNNGEKSFTNCSVTGLDMKLSGGLENNIGGFLTSVGGNGEVTFENCKVEGNIDAENTGEESAVGGFLGSLGWGGTAAVSIEKSSADVDIVANGSAGGFVANSDSNNGSAIPTIEIKESTASGDVKSISGAAGGFVAVGDRGTYVDCVANGAVSGKTAGGFWGEVTPNTSTMTEKTVTITNSEANGAVLGETAASGFVGTVATADADNANATTVKIEGSTAAPTVAGASSDTKVDSFASDVTPGETTNYHPATNNVAAENTLKVVEGENITMGEDGIVIPADATIQVNDNAPIYVPNGGVVNSTSGSLAIEADPIEVKFVEQTVDADGNAVLPYSLYNIVLTSESSINRLTAAHLNFTFEGKTINNVENRTPVSYEIVKLGDVDVAEDPYVPHRYLFNFDGEKAADETATTITIGQVKFGGYGAYTFSVTGDDNEAQATTKNDNIVYTYAVNGNVANGQGKLDIVGANISETIAVPTETLTINIAFPNAIKANAVEYQDMKVIISGGDLDGDLEYELGNENNYWNGTGYTVVIEDVLSQNTAYTVTVEGAGYRTAKYTVNMQETDKTLNFWNNVKTTEEAIEKGKATMASNFLAGDIVKDNDINIYDLSAVVSYFGETTDSKAAEWSYVKYDLNRDGEIDSKDVAYVLVSWVE